MGTIWLIALVMGSAVVAYAAIPNDGGRTWKTNPEAYRLGFAAGGADMLAMLDTDFRYKSLALQQSQIRSMSECVAREASLSALQNAVEEYIVKNPLPPPPHSPKDFPVVTADLSDVLLECKRSGPASGGARASEVGYRTADKLRIGGVGRHAARAYVTEAEWSPAAPPAFRNGYVAGAANMLRQVASLLQKEPADEVRQKVQKAGACVGSKYNTLATLHGRLDTEVSKDVAGGHNYTIASTLYVVLVDCR
ncbi:MAG TPA: hypothetical protein VFP86_16940 [bacterium]|nr:hypothetical protein [bacterium]